jgi:hypothetical protein
MIIVVSHGHLACTDQFVVQSGNAVKLQVCTLINQNDTAIVAEQCAHRTALG